MSPLQKQALDAAKDYLRAHPDEVGRAIRNALGLRVGIPVVALRFLAQQVEKGGKVSDLTIDTVPPGLRVAGNIKPMDTPIRFTATVYIDRVVFNESEMTIAIRVEDIALKVLGEAKTPIAALLKSGALNLANVGTLVGYLPNRPPLIVDARDNRVILDFMREPSIGLNPVVRKTVGLLTGFVTLSAVSSDETHLDVAFRALPSGITGAFRAMRQHAVVPSFGKLLPKPR